MIMRTHDYVNIILLLMVIMLQLFKLLPEDAVSSSAHCIGGNVPNSSA